MPRDQWQNIRKLIAGGHGITVDLILKDLNPSSKRVSAASCSNLKVLGVTYRKRLYLHLYCT